MKKISRFDRSNIDQISDDAVEALKPFAESRGLTVNKDGGKFDEGSCTMRVRFAVPDADRINFVKYAKSYGLKPEDFGREFVDPNNGKTYRITGIKLGNAKYSIIVEDENGKVMHYTETGVRRQLMTPEERAAEDAAIKARQAEWEARRAALLANQEATA